MSGTTWELTEYPEGSFGAAVAKLEREIAALPWYLAPFRWRLQRQMRRHKQRWAEQQDEAITRYFST